MNPLFLERMKQDLSDEYNDFLDSLQQEGFRGLRINTRKISTADFLADFHHLDSPSVFSEDSYYVHEPLGLHPWHICGAFYLQEPSASAVVRLLDLQGDETVLDLCAAPGSKSTQIIRALKNGFLVSNEFDARRARILLSNLERIGATNFACTNMDAHTLCSQLEGCFDKVLVDAPCSGEGMMKKHPEAMENWSLENIQACAAVQKDLLEEACRALKEGGILVYSTCTYAREENENQIRDFLARHPEMELLDSGVSFGRSGLETEGLDSSKVRRIYPMDQGEGQFMARMRKTEGKIRELPDCKNERPEKTVLSFLDDQTGTEFSFYHSIQKKHEKDQAWFGMNHPFVKFRKGKVLRQGVYLGDLTKKRFEPAYAFYLNADLRDDFLHKTDTTLEQMDAFMHGLPLEISVPKGYTAVCWKGLPYGFGKSDGRVIKNRIPKGLRLMEGSHLKL